MNRVMNIEGVSLRTKCRRLFCELITVLFFKPFPTSLFKLWRLFLLRLFGAEVVSSANVYSSVKIWAPWNLKMGRNSCLGPNVICYNQSLIELKEGAVVSQYAYLCTAGHDISMFNSAEEGLVVAPITIHENAWIGARAYIGMGVEIGECAVVGATASVYKDIEPYMVVGGNPAKFIKKRVFNDKSK